MKRVYVIVEGQTEEEFVNEVLAPFFISHGILDVRAFQLETSPGFRGGAVSWQRLKLNVELLLKREQDIVLTTFIDFFRLSYSFPCYQEGQSIVDKVARTTFLEEAMADGIQDHRFIPYIQLHEFEALLFSGSAGFNYLPADRFTNRAALAACRTIHLMAEQHFSVFFTNWHYKSEHAGYSIEFLKPIVSMKA